MNYDPFFLEMEEAFQLFDNRGDNKIHISHIGNALRALGQNPTESDVKKFAQQHKAGMANCFYISLGCTHLKATRVTTNFY